MATGHSPPRARRCPGAYLTADLGTWSTPPDPESYEFQWLRDGTAIAGATAQDYLVQVADVGHQLAPYVTGHSGGQHRRLHRHAVTVRKIDSLAALDVRRVHPAPDQARLVWTAISFMSTERPWTTDGGTVTAYRQQGRPAEGARPAVRHPRRARSCGCPGSGLRTAATKVMVCFQGSDVVDVSCSPLDVVRRAG